MTSPHGRLTPLQQEILDAFFSSTSSFVLTRGAALAGFHLLEPTAPPATTSCASIDQ